MNAEETELTTQLQTDMVRRIIWLGIINLTLVLTVLIILNGTLLFLLPFVIVYACGAPFISLFFSKFFVKQVYDLHILEEDEEYAEDIMAYRKTVEMLCERAGMKNLPEIAYYESEDRNAFSTGRSRDRALLAASTGLIENMSEEGIEAVVAHEIAHIMNGDMVTQTLLESAVNLVVAVILLPIALYQWGEKFRKNPEPKVVRYLILAVQFIVGILLFFMSRLLLNIFSRAKEYRADQLAALLTSPEHVMHALKELETPADLRKEHKKFSMIQFNGSNRVRLFSWFSSHPSIPRRIKNLEIYFNKSE